MKVNLFQAQESTKRASSNSLWKQVVSCWANIYDNAAMKLDFARIISGLWNIKVSVSTLTPSAPAELISGKVLKRYESAECLKSNSLTKFRATNVVANFWCHNHVISLSSLAVFFFLQRGKRWVQFVNVMAGKVKTQTMTFKPAGVVLLQLELRVTSQKCEIAGALKIRWDKWKAASALRDGQRRETGNSFYRAWHREMGSGFVGTGVVIDSRI